MRNKKTNRGISIIFFRADDYTVVMETFGVKYWYKENAKESNRDCKSYGTIDLSFNIAIV